MLEPACNTLLSAEDEDWTLSSDFPGQYQILKHWTALSPALIYTVASHIINTLQGMPTVSYHIL